MSAPDTRHTNPRTLLRLGRLQMLHNLVAGARVGTWGAYLGGPEQAISRSLPHDELVRVQRRTSQAGLPAGLAGPGDGVACPEAWATGPA